MKYFVKRFFLIKKFVLCKVVINYIYLKSSFYLMVMLNKFIVHLQSYKCDSIYIKYISKNGSQFGAICVIYVLEWCIY